MIIVCSLKDLETVCKSVKPSHLISVIDPGYAPNTPNGVKNHLKLGFDDITEVNSNNHIFRPVTFVNSKVGLEKYFKILSLKYIEFKQTQLNFAEYKHKDNDTVDFINYISEYYLK